MGQPLSDTEALLWSLGRDPNLASTMGLIAILDSRPDVERVRNTVAATVAGVERLQQRIVSPSVASPSSSFGRPEWVTDDRFDLDHHFRVMRLGSPTTPTEADLRLAASQFINDPFDEARPLWQFRLVLGLARGRAALLGKVHHSISDGLGLLRLAGNLLELEADAPPPEPVDLVGLLRADLERNDPRTPASSPDRMLGWLQSAAQALSSPIKVFEAGSDAISSVRAVGSHLPKAKPSPLWAERSRNRRLELLAVPLSSLRARADDLGATLNDLFVAACAQGAVHYHGDMGVDLSTVTATVVVNTSKAVDGSEADNSFLPAVVELPGTAGSAGERLEAVRTEVRARRASVDEHGDLLGGLGTIGGLVPSSVAAALAVDHAAKVDFATSNIPGPPMPTWLAGCPIRRLFPVGPVAGTAFNVTMMTFDREALLGIHIDPAAVADTALLRSCLGRGFGDFGVVRR